MDLSVTALTLRQFTAAQPVAAEKLGSGAWQISRQKKDEPVSIQLDALDLAELTSLRDIMKVNNELQVRQISKLINNLSDTENRRVDNLRDLPQIIIAYLKKNGPHLYEMRADLRGVAYLVYEVRFVEERRSGYGSSDPHVRIDVAYNTRFAFNTSTYEIYKKDIKLALPQILRNLGLMTPDTTQVEDYEKMMARYRDYGNRHGEQFLVRGEAPEISSGGWWWSKEALNMAPSGKLSRTVLDLDGRDRDRSRSTYSCDFMGADTEFPVPTHPVLPMFSLLHHKMVWVNVINMKPYKYDSKIADKLVLPASHTRLVSALVSNLDALRAGVDDDEGADETKSRIIREKASSSVILAKGPAGTGKTLTAEVYAETIKRPLYEVQSGQLGTDADTVESNLQKILARSVRLNMPLLINEADVFIQKRGTDLEQNAVVSVFLRLLEYHNGLLFLTTNLIENIDSAIPSRCIAEIAYETPAPNERLRLWRIMLAEFDVKLPKGSAARLVRLFPEVAGRDIQNLIRLASRVATALGEKVSVDSMIECAVFKSIRVAEEHDTTAVEDDAE